jgi:hypothetical protein
VRGNPCLCSDAPQRRLPLSHAHDKVIDMANIISFLFGFIALILAIIGFIPLLGALNWINILIAGVGIAFGAASSKNAGRNFCIVVAVICAIRLWLGGGII